MSTSDRRYWVRPPGGRPTGPFKAVELRALASLGRVAPDDHVRDGEAGKWHLATQVKNLFGTAVLRAEAEKQLRKRLGGKVALPPVRRAAAARPAAGRDDATPRDAAKPRGEAYGGGGDGSAFDVEGFDSDTAAEQFERSAVERSGAGRSVVRAPPPATIDRPDGAPRADAGGDDLPDAVVGTDDEFLDSLGVAAAGRARRGPCPDAASAARAASSGAADDLLTRARRGEGFCDDDGDGGPALPARRRARRAGRDDDGDNGGERAAASAAQLNRLILLTVLTIPLAVFGFVRVTQGHQSDAREWREAFDRLDDVMNEFVEVAHGSETDWVRWRDRYRDAEPEIVYLVERAGNGTAGDHIERAVGQINAAVALRERGIAGEALKVPVEEAVKHAQTAGGKLGIGKFEWAH